MKPFDWVTGYPSLRMPMFGRNCVATSHALAAQAGIQMLQAGGNAVDAAIATAAAKTVTEPCSNGLGSDAFCILWDGKALHGLNASGGAPAAWSRDYFLQKYGAKIAKAQQDNPKQWQHWWWVCFAGQVVFIPFVFVLSGRWSPRKARRDEEEHERFVESEMARLGGAPVAAAGEGGAAPV